MDLKHLTPQEKLDLVRMSAFRAGDLFAKGLDDPTADPCQIMKKFRDDLNHVLDLIEEMGIDES